MVFSCGGLEIIVQLLKKTANSNRFAQLCVNGWGVNGGLAISCLCPLFCWLEVFFCFFFCLFFI